MMTKKKMVDMTKLHAIAMSRPPTISRARFVNLADYQVPQDEFSNNLLISDSRPPVVPTKRTQN